MYNIALGCTKAVFYVIYHDRNELQKKQNFTFQYQNQ